MLGALAMPGHCMLLNSGKKNRTRAAVASLEKPSARELNHWLPRFIVEARYEDRKLYPHLAVYVIYPLHCLDFIGTARVAIATAQASCRVKMLHSRN